MTQRWWVHVLTWTFVGSAAQLLVAQTPPAPTTRARLEAPQVARGNPLTVVFTGGPASVTTAQVELTRRDSTARAALVAKYTPPSDGRSTSVEVAVPDDQPLGDYSVVAILDGSRYVAGPGRISILPFVNAQVHLNDFSPAFTYATEQTQVPRDPRPRQIVVRRIRLRDPVAIAKQRQITMTGPDVRSDIIWSGCENAPPLSTYAQPVEAMQVYGNHNSDGVVELCHVPEDATPQVDLSIVPFTGTSATDIAFLGARSEGVAKQTITLILRGTGFLVEKPQENEIWIDGVRQTSVAWDSCDRRDLTTGTRTAPRALSIHAQAVSAEEIRLCGIEVPANGEMRIAAGFGDTPSETRRFTVYSMNAWAVTWRASAIAIVLALVPLWLLSRARRAHRIAGREYRYVSALFLDLETNTYSLSKLQFYLWTVAALFGYAYLFISRVRVQNLTWPDVPGTLPAIIAVSAGTAVGSQVITSMKGSKGGGEELPTVADLITSGGVVAADRVQMLLWTLLGVGAFIVALVHEGPGTINDLPAVPEKLLYLMGLSSTGYLAGKLARKAGPVIAEISITPSDSDENLAKRSGSLTVPDITQAAGEAHKAVSAFKPAANGRAKQAIAAFEQAVAAAAGVHTSAEFAELLKVLDTHRTNAEQAATDVAAQQAKEPPTATAEEASAAQQAAAGIQTLLSGVLDAIAFAAATQMDAIVAPMRADRVIEVRGTNLSPDATLQIDHSDLPFRMLTNAQGQHAPDLVVRDDTNPTFARVLRLNIVRSALDTSDQQLSDVWFATAGSHALSLTNPDGQKAELKFTIPPAEAQKVGSTP